VHVILDNYAAHKHAKVRAWLERHPRWTFHFTPTSASWLNAVEGFFAKLRVVLPDNGGEGAQDGVGEKGVAEEQACQKTPEPGEQQAAVVADGASKGKSTLHRRTTFFTGDYLAEQLGADVFVANRSHAIERAETTRGHDTKVL
jgi:hypothetical protein